MAQQASQLRSLYRRLLRELPSRQPSILANPSPIQSRIRSAFATPQPTQDEHSNITPWSSPQDALSAGEQIVQYLAAQRMYTTLVERYNPGMNMSEEERVRLTARKVGMDLPVQFMMGNKPGSGSGSGHGSGGGPKGGSS